jgi:RNA polymerase sigma-70 factor, ECF subfamily
MTIGENYLINGLKDNNKEAYTLIFRTYYRELLYIAVKYTQNQDEAKDLVQSTFIKFWSHRLDLDENKPVKPYLWTIHRNNCLDWVKHNNIEEKYNANPGNFENSDPITPYEQLIFNNLEYKILEAISELPEKCRIIFEYSRFEGLKYIEIAEKLNISVKTVENQISNALDKLRKKLSDFLILLFALLYHFL